MDIATSHLTPHPLSNPTNGVAEKVLRRVQIAKVARSLQDRLALANFKAQHGWQNRTLKTIEPEITERLRRKRPYPSGDRGSETSSASSEDFFSYSSPLMAPAVSDETWASKDSHSAHAKDPLLPALPPAGRHKRVRPSTAAAQTRPLTGTKSWKQPCRLTQSSPTFPRSRRLGDHKHRSVAWSTASATDSYRDRFASLDQQASLNGQDDLPIHSFDQEPELPAQVNPSPPRTPSPSRRFRPVHSRESGADLLLYLANSPCRSPAFDHQQTSGVKNSAHFADLEPPSTPPTQHTSTSYAPLPSSFFSTPTTSTSGTDLPLFSTPGQNFNFADFVNVTPSPAQLPWGGRTPGAGVNQTPGSMRAGAARRGLNFDALAPPSSNSPSLRKSDVFEVSGKGNGNGLALELGEKLWPRS